MSIVLTFGALNLLEEETQHFGESRDRNISFRETGRFFIVGGRGEILTSLVFYNTHVTGSGLS